ncbi:tumor necrosis factor-inducible gene 6 protein-like isoform X2 [Tubulanus polymorphus]
MVLFDSSLTVTSECRVEDPVELEARAAPQFLQSPNYPFFYKPLTYCRWILKAKESHVITVEVLDTDTEGSPTCNKDFIEIRDGKYQWDYALRRWCGNKLPANFTGYKDAMFVTFKTDDSEQGRGFRFKYWSTPKHL